MSPIEAGDTDRIMDSEPEWRKQTDLVSQNLLSNNPSLKQYPPPEAPISRDYSWPRFNVNSIIEGY